MAAITISRQLGSQGDEVAQMTAQLLGYRVVHRELINEAARRAHAPEMALEAVDVLGLLDVHPTQKARRSYQQAIYQLMQEIAQQGNAIIIGRAGCTLLAERSDVLHVRLIAPIAWRIKRLARILSINLDAAREQIETSDRARYTYVYQNYKVDWNDPQLYTLILNMEKLTVNDAAALICLAHDQSLKYSSSASG